MHTAMALRKEPAKQCATCKFDDTEKWMRDNPFLRAGYRYGCCTTQLSLRSVFQWHNETLNIWTHLIGAIGLFALLVHNLITDGRPFAYELINGRADGDTGARGVQWPLHLFVVCAMTCLGLSVTLHTFSHQSHETLMRVIKLDLLGISVLNYGECMAYYYYALQCHPLLQYAIIGVITVLMIVTTFVSISVQHSNPKRARNLVLVFGTTTTLVFFTALPVRFTLQYDDGYSPADPFFYGVTSLVVYGLGALVYANKIPERYFPGKFDYLGASHQLWHVFVLVGITFGYFMGVSNYGLRERYYTCTAPVVTV